MSSVYPSPKFPATKDSLHAELKKRVQAYFDEKGIDATGTPGLFTKAILMILALIAVYVHVVFFTPIWWLAIAECIVMGGLVAAIGFNVMHDGSHGSFSTNKWLNKIAASSISLLGANRFMWRMKHVMIHHTFTNVDGVDDDIEVGGLMRMAPTQKKYGIHKFQHVYFWALYMLLYVFWIFFTDYKKYFSQKIGSVPLKKMELKDHIEFWVVKVYHAAVFVVLPIALLGWVKWLVGFLVMTMFAGFVLSIVFQLAHTVEHTDFPVVDDQNKLPDEFAAHQIKTTANFAMDNKVISWFVGGLNYQIEHHLFSNISHVHYRKLSAIVKETAAEFNLPYHSQGNFFHAVASHLQMLKQLGRA